MHCPRPHIRITFFTLLVALLALGACRTTRHVPDGKYMLRKNSINLRSRKVMYNKGEIRDNLSHMVIQKANTRTFFKTVPLKLNLFNWRYHKLKNRPDSLLPKSVEKPAILDTSLVTRSMTGMHNYLFHQGYFYARITDTVKVNGKKARVTYNVDAGGNYLVNKVIYDIDDSNIAHIVNKAAQATAFARNKEFTYSMADNEISRLTNLIRDNGYYHFTQDNIHFVLDTLDKAMFKDVENPFENALSFISSNRNTKPTTDVNTIINSRIDSANIQYTIGSVTVFPDYDTAATTGSGEVIRKMIDSIVFFSRGNFVHPKVLADHIYLHPGHLFAQSEYDRTILKLNELGIYQYVRIQFRENRDNHHELECIIYLSKTKKHDFSANTEISSGTTYQLGNSVGVTYRDKNFAKGANLLQLSLTGGLELAYNDNVGKQFPDHFGLLTEYYGANGSIDFPKFIAPVPASIFDISNLPHTIINGGTNVINRVQYFTLVNTSANFQYSWHSSSTTQWDFSPAFVNIIRLPRETDSFRRALDSNAFLKDSYKQTFIEGENITFTYSNFEKNYGKNYTYVRLGAEEAGGLLGAINSLGYALNDLYHVKYSQYVKFDFDARRFFNLPHSIFAFRFYGGYGVPYGQSVTLPYIKQYYVGGPYSLRGWRIRSLGPGSYYDAATALNNNIIDLTGDIKLEANGEYRFPITPLFAGSVKMNGVLFADAGNIWLAKRDSAYAGGEFQLNRLGQDIAMDLGTGARFEIASFLTFRLDVAIPVKKPYVFENNGWVFNKIDLWNPSWRANNVIVNISIGYPF